MGDVADWLADLSRAWQQQLDSFKDYSPCGLASRGFNVVVVGNLTATDDRELHEAELKTLRKGFARVLSLKELLAELRQTVSPR
jgi:hypothetical protein